MNSGIIINKTDEIKAEAKNIITKTVRTSELNLPANSVKSKIKNSNAVITIVIAKPFRALTILRFLITERSLISISSLYVFSILNFTAA